MKAAVIYEHGGPGSIKYETAYPDPRPAADEVVLKVGAATLNYGLFLNAVVQFLIVAFVLFLVIRGMNKLQKPAAAAAPTTEKCGDCLMDVPIGAKVCGHCTARRAA